MFHLYSWGANSHGQLGQGDESPDEIIIPQKVDLSSTDLKPENITKIVGGGGHTLILDQFGTVYSCGWNDKGQAGTVDSSSNFKKLKYFDDEKIRDIACGWNSSMALTENGELFTWGSNSHGQLGLVEIPVGGKTYEPLKVRIDKSVERISMGLRHSALITRDSKVLVCGASSKGQLGIKYRDAKHLDTFTEVPGLQDATEIACGQYHTIVGTKFSIFSWGDNKYGQLGVHPNTRKSSLTPIRTATFIKDFTKIYCGWTHTAVITSQKRIFSCGRNSYGQLGYANSDTVIDEADTKTDGGKRKLSSPSLDSPVKPNKSVKIRQLSVGSEHNVAISDAGTILSWGWNEHGNCGNGTTENLFQPTKVLLPETSGILVGTGAGHSFAVITMLATTEN